MQRHIFSCNSFKDFVLLVRIRESVSISTRGIFFKAKIREEVSLQIKISNLKCSHMGDLGVQTPIIVNESLSATVNEEQTSNCLLQSGLNSPPGSTDQICMTIMGAQTPNCLVNIYSVILFCMQQHFTHLSHPHGAGR